MAIARGKRSLRADTERSKRASDTPSTNSMAMNSSPLASPKSTTCTMLGWQSAAQMRASSQNMATKRASLRQLWQDALDRETLGKATRTSPLRDVHLSHPAQSEAVAQQIRPEHRAGDNRGLGHERLSVIHMTGPEQETPCIFPSSSGDSGAAAILLAPLLARLPLVRGRDSRARGARGSFSVDAL